MKINMNQQKKARVEMLPLMDVIFLLLVFFIYAMLSMTVHQGVELSLPSSSSAIQENKKIMAISINAGGQVFLNKVRILEGELIPVLQDKLDQGNKPEARLFADKAVSYERVFQVLDQLKLAGVHQISLQAEKGGKK